MNKANISVAKKGMNRSTIGSQLTEQEYVIAKNANLESLEGDTFTLTNEQSNILASKFSEGFKVIGLKNDVGLNKTFFFLTNPQTKISEFGYILNIKNVENLSDIEVECSECNYKNILATPLENIIQTPYQNYVTLLSDCEDNLCFNFSIQYPIKDIEIKTEKTSSTIFFTDFYNPPRYIQLDNLESYSYNGEIVCSDETNVIPTCLACNKMKIFKDFTVPQITPENIMLGGRLRMGTYQFLIAYSDELGNEISEYYNITNRIDIFDQNNNILEQENLADRTNFSIKLKIEGLDKNYTHYKVAVIQVADINNAVSYFIEGVHPINDSTIIYSSEENKERTDLQTLSKQNIFVKKWEGITQSNNYLFGYGVEVEKEMNLQPVINLAGQFLKWQTHLASEDLYKNGVASSLYLGYNRDEVVPFGLRFYTKSGYRTSVFPFIGRLPEEKDLQIVNTDNKDRLSIESSLTNCVNTERTKRWQFYNDAEIEGVCAGSDDIPTIPVEEEIQKICYIEDIAMSSDEDFILQLEEPYTGLEDFIEDNKGKCVSNPNIFGDTDLCQLLDPNNYEDQNCTVKALTITGTSGTANIIINDIPYLITFNTNIAQTVLDFVTANYTAIESSTDSQIIANGSSIEFTTSYPSVDIENATGDIGGYFSGLFEGNCTNITLTPSTLENPNPTIEITSITNETFVGIDKIFPDEYSRALPPQNCLFLIPNSDFEDFEYELDFEFMTLYMTCGYFLDFTCVVYKRDYSFFNEACAYAEEMLNVSDFGSNYYTGYFFNYLGSDSIAGLQSTKNAICATGNFTDKIHKKALWFFGKKLGREKFILEITKQNVVSPIDSIAGLNSANEVRVSIFNRCSDTDPIYCKIITVDQGVQFYLNNFTTTSFDINDGTGAITISEPLSNTFFVALDCPIVMQSPVADTNDPSNPEVFVRYVSTVTNGCFSILTRDNEFSGGLVSWEEIVFRKKTVYTSSCTFDQPVVQKCKAVPHKYGKLAYYESEEIYPDNQELYNSSKLKIKSSQLPGYLINEFESKFTNGVNEDGDYIWLEDNTGKEIIDFTCRNIRHPRLPDNQVSPFMYERPQTPFNSSVIYPLGVTIDENIINKLLDIAVLNNLITQTERDDIVKYEFVRGNISNDRSVQASGLVYDMRRYIEKNKFVHYSNYPFNDLGLDLLNLGVVQQPIESNGKFTFHSPETDYYKTTLPNEMVVQGYMFGKSKGNFDQVKNHPKWVILTAKAKDLALSLAALEASAEIAIASAQAASNAQIWGVAGTGSTGVSTGAPAYAAAAVIAALGIVEGIVSKLGRYRYEWLKVFRDLGQPQNFAYYYYAEGNYNFMRPLQEDGERVRNLNIAKKLKANKSVTVDETLGERVTINNIDREESVFLSTGNFPITYDDVYKNYDNNFVDFNGASITYASQNSECVSGKSGDIIRNVASPYVALKNYVPSQYGSINSIEWMTTGYMGDLKNPSSSCLPVFGGDTYISRHTLKRKIPLFLTDAMDLASMTPFNYSFYNNIGKFPRFYCDFELNRDFSKNSTLFPDIDSDYVFDCNKKQGSYVIPPSKFYLYYYGIPSFLCETRVNTNYRYAKPEPEKNFYPEVGDVGDWTQETNVSVKRPNFFFYNEIYSRKNIQGAIRTLPDSYSKTLYDTIYDRPNGVMYSLPDNEENNLNEPWLIYKPLDFYEFPSDYGKLIDLKGIENNQVLCRFENQTAIYNSVDVTVETGQSISGNYLGNGGIFSRRPVTFSETDLGYMGSQTSNMVSCEYGHFFVDAKRGYVFRIETGGKGVEQISSYIGGKPSGMAHWFKKHLPFKILESNIQGVDVDNALNGVGITMGWDSRFKRVFITKRDYKIVNKTCLKYDRAIGFYTDCNEGNVKTPIEFTNETYFKDVSWTIAFSTTLNSWLSYYDFKPNYYIAHNDYFQTGVNNSKDELEFGLWSHLLTNKSYQVFYGKKYDFLIEYPDKNVLKTKTLHSIDIWSESRRYHEEYDYSYSPDIVFNQAYIFNNNNNSGLLNLVPQKNNFVGKKGFPKTNNDNTQDILISNKDNFEWSFDYIFNRVNSNNKNEPNWLWDDNQINKTINQKAVSFKGKKVLEYLTGDYFIIGLNYNKSSQYQILHKFSTQNYDI